MLACWTAWTLCVHHASFRLLPLAPALCLLQTSLRSPSSTFARCRSLIMVLGLREVIAMTAADRRTCWLAGSLPVLPSVVIVLFLRCQELLPGALNVDWSAICEIASCNLASPRQERLKPFSTFTSLFSCLRFDLGNVVSWRQ